MCTKLHDHRPNGTGDMSHSAFSVDVSSAPYCPIWINLGLINLDPCAFQYTKFDDNCLKLSSCSTHC